MKITMSAESKKVLTLEEAPIARKIIEDLKEDDTTVAEYAKYAMDAACQGNCIEIFKATAIITKNNRVYNALTENSGTLDVWIEATAQTSYEFCIIGAYLTDIWNLSAETQKDIVANHMYVRRFLEVK